MRSRSPLIVLFIAALAGCQTMRPRPGIEAASAPPDEWQSATPAPARKPFDEHLSVRVGGMVAGHVDTTAALGVRNTNVGTEFDFERELGLDEQTESLRIDAFYRWNRSNRIDVGYFDISRSGARTISRDIQWGDTTFPVNATVSSYLDTQIIPVRYTHSFVATDDVDVGLGLGVYFMTLETGLRANGLGLSQTFDTPLPLPVLALHGTWEFLPRLQMFGTVQAFYIDLQGIGEIENLRGSLVDVTLGLEYELLDHASLGVAVDYFEMTTDTASQRLTLDVDYSYTALFAFLTFSI